MGVDTRRPTLPAPTESIVDTTPGGSATGTDLATDISRRTDKTSYSIPDDGSPVTIPTRRKHRDRDDSSKLSRSSHHSQTSLLIEYFEGGKGPGALSSRPSVRVRVTPSAARRLKDKNDQIQITESGGGRKPVYTRRISLSSPSKQRQLVEPGTDDQSISSSNSAADEGHHSSRHPPLEIEFVNRDQGSEMSTLSRDTRYIPATSDISSMPPDSMLEAPSSGPRRKRSQSLDRAVSPDSKDLLKTPSRQRSRSLSTERIAHRVAEKLSNDPREASSSKHKRPTKSRGGNKDLLDVDTKSPRRRLAAYRDDDFTSVESSLLSGSAVSSHRRSGDQYSFRSGTSKSSINNPKLLETVEDAIRRLILPELKELKKDQKVISNTSKFERDMNASYSSASSTPRDELGRRLSKHASAPDVMKPKVVLNKGSKDEGIVLADSHPTKKERKPSKETGSPSDKNYVKWGNRPELTEQDKLRRQKSKGLRDLEAARLVGTALTAAALKHHDSKSSLASNESGRRRRRSNRRSRSGSINETELVFQKHNVAPMPLRSALDSELTRDSLLSQHSAGTATPTQDAKVHDVFSGSPLQVRSPKSRTPTRTPLDSRYELGIRHSNLSNHNLSIHSASDRDVRERSRSPMGDAFDDGETGAIAAAAAANLLDAHPEHGADAEFDDGVDRRALSPIQSVASDKTETHRQEQPMQHDQHAESDGERQLEPRLSIDSLSSAPSTNLARSTRPEAVSFESRSELLKQHDQAGPELGYEDSPRPSGGENWDDGSETEEESSPRNGDPEKRMTNYTDDSELSYLEKVNQGQHVADVVGANPQFVHPIAVESAVASLLDPSVLDSKSTQSGNRSHGELGDQQVSRSPKLPDNTPHEPQGSRRGSPLKQRQNAASPDETSFPKRMGLTSPPQSVTQSIEEQYEPEHMLPNDLHGAESPFPEGDHSQDSESEINTNPSIIQGPIGGVPHENRDHWPYNATPPKADQMPLTDAAAGAGLGFAAGEHMGYGQDYYQPAPEDAYASNGYFDQPTDAYAGGQLFATPPGAKDEGYVSAANPRSPSVDTPKPKGMGGLDAMGLFDSADDTFSPSHQRHMSGYSHGMASPLYDGATGRGLESIQSKDIIALMDHLTVRDAQRNARDTEILVTLVRSAAEMRNSFEEMKKFIAHQDGVLMEASDKQHERTQKAIGGPRPQPFSGSRSARQMSVDEGEDLRSKRKNLFKRALKGLSLRSSNDLTKIEEMLEQLLEEVEALRAAQDGRIPRNGPWAASVDQNGYEPEGQAGTSSTENQSGYLSNSSRQAYDARGNDVRKDSEGRVSTVHEADEDMDLDERGEFLSPHLPSMEQPTARHERAGSVPLATPPRVPVASGALSNETTPKATEKARKHKSSSSSFFPKISRWSKTTASSMGDNIRNSIQPGRKERPFSDASRSGSDLANGPYKTADYYDPQGDDRIRSSYTLDEQQQQENRPPSPLVPSQVSEAPKYRAHRDSLDLQHPQPRQGPTGRYQTQLESQAYTFGSPISPSSEQWGSNTSLPHSATNHNRYSGGGRLSPISDAGYSDATSRAENQSAPPRPPKIKDDGPLVPERPPKVKEVEEGSYADRVASRSSAAMRSSPRYTPPRKPTGPRPLTSSNQNSPGNVKRTRYRGSPDQVDDEDEY